jgi:hypothetical protein
VNLKSKTFLKYLICFKIEQFSAVCAIQGLQPCQWLEGNFWIMLHRYDKNINIPTKIKIGNSWFFIEFRDFRFLLNLIISSIFVCLTFYVFLHIMFHVVLPQESFAESSLEASLPFILACLCLEYTYKPRIWPKIGLPNGHVNPIRPPDSPYSTVFGSMN